jgi:hypothetical protein
MVDNASTQLNLEAVEIALRSFAEHRNSGVEERIAFLESHAEANSYLRQYFYFTEADLKLERISLQMKLYMLITKERGEMLRLVVFVSWR